MPDPTDIAEEIAEAALKPASATIDGNSVSQVSIGDKIKAAEYVEGRQANAANRPLLGARIQKIRRSYT